MSLFQSNLRKQIRKLPKILESVKFSKLFKLFNIIQYYSFVSLGIPPLHEWTQCVRFEHRGGARDSPRKWRLIRPRRRDQGHSLSWI